MKLVNLILCAFCMFCSIELNGQNVQDSSYFIPPNNSYFSEYGQSINFYGKVPPKNRLYRVSRYVTWEAGYALKGILASGQGLRLGSSRFMINSVVGVHILRDAFQRNKLNMFRDFGKAEQGSYAIYKILRHGNISNSGLYLQGSVSFDFRSLSNSVEVGFRYSKSEWTVTEHIHQFGFYNIRKDRIEGINNVPIKLFSIYVALMELDTQKKDNSIKNYRIGLSLDYYEFQKNERIEIPSVLSPKKYYYVKSGTYRDRPFLFLMFSFGIGRGYRAE